VVLGLLFAGAIGAWVPEEFWRSFFLTDYPVASALWGPIVGPIVAILSFVCSIGNVPLAAVLWNGGISFGGVTAFIYADLVILPILNIYRKYYGARMALVILGTFYAAMVGAGYLVEFLFGITGLIPTQRSARVMEEGIMWNYTTWLNIVFLVLATVLVVRFVRTGGIAMLRMMGGSPDAADQHNHFHNRHSHHHSADPMQPATTAQATSTTGTSLNDDSFGHSHGGRRRVALNLRLCACGLAHRRSTACSAGPAFR
jgi:uncharacterized protein